MKRMSTTPQMHKRLRLFVRIVSILLLLILLAATAGVLYIRRSLPTTVGSVQISGLRDRVEIARDASGVPHIYATTDHDAFFALGYVHAQDRMWQMEFQRRIGAGRLSEILGEEALQTDKALRTLGMYRAAQAAWPALDRNTQAAVQAYTDGVNAWIDARHVLPPEFLILGVKPSRWTVIDSTVWAKMVAWTLGGNYGLELLRMRLARELGPEHAAQLLPAAPSAGPTILGGQALEQTVDGLLALDTHLRRDLHLGGLGVGSNSWVVGGKRSKSGLPLLANDPHLDASIPSTWYLAELHGDKLHVVGATMPGLPAVVIGHNDNIAWGATALTGDEQDLYLERINPDNPDQYDVEGRWVDMTIVEEPIYVKGAAQPVVWKARSTRHGPLLSDVSSRPPSPMAIRWTGLEPNDTTPDSYIKINYASNWEEFNQALSSYVAPTLNFIYADHAGNIGYKATGKLPIRSKGEGMAPVDGWDSGHEWDGWIPFDKLPAAFNPPNGYIVTANNRVSSQAPTYFISNDWDVTYRAQRITDLIEQLGNGDRKLTADDFATIQGDQLSLQAKELLPVLLQVAPADARQTEALRYLESWDAVTAADSVATTIYEAWVIQMTQTILKDKLGGPLYEELVERAHPIFLASVLRTADSWWCDAIQTKTVEDCPSVARDALSRALADLETRLGADMAAWQWGKLHRVQFPHMPFADVSYLRGFFQREIANGGDDYTVDIAPIAPTEPYLQYHIPSYRQIVDLSDWANSRYMHAPGQSGNVLSGHYDDLLKQHQAVGYLPMTFGREQIHGDTLVLLPGT